MHSLRLAVILLLPTSLFAQSYLPGGTLGIVGDAWNAMATLPAGGGTPTCVNPPLGGAAEAILWDPSQPDSFLVAGRRNATGYVDRVRFTATTAVVVTNLATGQGLESVVQLSFGGSANTVIAADNWNHQVYSVDLASGSVTPVTGSSNAWSNGLTCGARDPRSGNIFVGTGGGDIFQVQPGTGTVTPFQTGLGGPIQKIIFDDTFAASPTAGPYFLVYTTDDSLQRFDLTLASPPRQAFFWQSYYPIGSVARDAQGNYVFARSQSDVYRVQNQATDPLGGVSATFLGSSGTCTGGGHHDLDVVGGVLKPFRLDITPYPAGNAVMNLVNWPAGATQGWLLPTSIATFPRNAGPMFGIWPDATTVFIFSFPASLTNPFHFICGSGCMPPYPFTVTGLQAIVGYQWDVVAVAFSNVGFVARTDVVRVTWL